MVIITRQKFPRSLWIKKLVVIEAQEYMKALCKHIIGTIELGNNSSVVIWMNYNEYSKFVEK